MPSWTGLGDFDLSNLPNEGGRGTQSYRPYNTAAVYSPGTILQLVPIDSQIYPDFQTVQPSPATANNTLLVGVADASWAGFDNNGVVPTSYTTLGSQLNIAGTQLVMARVKGITYVFVDATSGATISNGVPLQSSQNTVGYAQGVAKGSSIWCEVIAQVNLPASGIGSSMANASLVQASQTFTVATPAAGDTVNTVIQSPYTDIAPGVAQTTTWSLTLNATTAASATTAGNAIVAFLNLQPGFSQYFTATNTAGAVLVTVNAKSTPFLVTGTASAGGSGALEQWRFYTFISGVVANTLTTSGSVNFGAGGTTTYSASSANMGGTTSGTGYKGKVPATINGQY